MSEGNILRVPVTPEHISEGIPSRVGMCPLAIALRDHPRIIRSSVYWGTIDLDMTVEEGLPKKSAGPYRQVGLTVSSTVNGWVQDFDIKGPELVSPGTLLIDLDTHYAQFEEEPNVNDG